MQKKDDKQGPAGISGILPGSSVKWMGNEIFHPEGVLLICNKKFQLGSLDFTKHNIFGRFILIACYFF